MLGQGFRASLCLALLWSMALWSLPNGSWAQPADEAALEEAKFLYQDGEFETAALQLRELALRATTVGIRVEAWLYLGFCRLNLGAEKEAREAFQQVLRMVPDFRLDPLRFPPKLRTAFEEARASSRTTKVADIVSLLEPMGKLSPPLKKVPSEFSRKWYQKWWLWAGVGAVGITAAVLLSGGGGDGYVAPDLVLKLPEPNCTRPPGVFAPGEVELSVAIDDGESPYALTFSLRRSEDAKFTEVGWETISSKETSFVFQGLEAFPGGGCQQHLLRVKVLDAQKNHGQDVERQTSLTVCTCFE